MIEIKTLDEAKRMVQNDQINSFCWLSCINCAKFSPHTEQCLKFNEKPPAKVIVHGCQYWEMDIPF